MNENEQQKKANDKRDSGLPGGGAGRVDEVGHTGIYPLSAQQQPQGDAPIVPEGELGQGERGPQGYYDSGSSETFTVPDDNNE